MQVNKLKNMIVLNNLNSNIIEEAFIVFKKNININDFQNCENNYQQETLLKEAENIVKTYAEELSSNNRKKIELERLKKQNKRTKIINLALIILSIIFIIK